MTKEKKKSIGWWIFLVILLVLVIGSVIYFPQKTVTCEKTVTKQETYYEREPYTVCAGHSFWTGKCNAWKTEYENVLKTRTVNVQEPYDTQVNWLYGTCN